MKLQVQFRNTDQEEGTPTPPHVFARLSPDAARALHLQAVRTMLQNKGAKSPEIGGISGGRNNGRIAGGIWSVLSNHRDLPEVEFLPLKISYEVSNERNTVYASYNGGHVTGTEAAVELHQSLFRSTLSTPYQQSSSWSSSSSTSPWIRQNHTDMLLPKQISITALPVVKNATRVTVEPLTVSDWELIECFADVLQSDTLGGLLQQVSIIYPNQILPLYLAHGSTMKSSVSSKDVAYIKILPDSFRVDSHESEDLAAVGGDDDFTSETDSSSSSLLNELTHIRSENEAQNKDAFGNMNRQKRFWNCLRLVQDTEVVVVPKARATLKSYAWSKPIRVFPIQSDLSESAKIISEKLSAYCRVNQSNQDITLSSSFARLHQRFYWKEVLPYIPVNDDHRIPMCILVHPTTLLLHIPGGSEIESDTSVGKYLSDSSQTVQVCRVKMRKYREDISDGSDDRTDGDPRYRNSSISDNKTKDADEVVVKLYLNNVVARGHVGK